MTSWAGAYRSCVGEVGDIKNTSIIRCIKEFSRSIHTRMRSVPTNGDRLAPGEGYVIGRECVARVEQSSRTDTNVAGARDGSAGGSLRTASPARAEPPSGSASGLVTDERDGGALTWRLLITRMTPGTLRASCSASAFTCVLGTSLVKVTTPLVTWKSTALSYDTTLPRRMR
jgi:hypothetical protein